MKSTIAENIPSKIEYPCLMRSAHGYIVLFSSHGSGTCLHDPFGVNATVGNHSEKWGMDDFAPFYGSITLSN